MKKRIISFCLVFCMLLSYVPVGALAAEGEDFGEVVEELAQEQEKSAEALPEETTEEPAEATAEELPPEPTEEEPAPEESAEEQPAEEEPTEEQPAEEQPVEEEPAEEQPVEEQPTEEEPAEEQPTEEEPVEELPVEVEAPAAPLVLTARAEDGVQVVLTAEFGAFMDGETVLTAQELTLTAAVVEGDEAENAQSNIDSANVLVRTTYDVCVMYGGVELQPVPGKSVSVAFVVPTVPQEAEAVSVYHHDEEGNAETIVEEQSVDPATKVSVAPIVEQIIDEVVAASVETPVVEDELTQEAVAAAVEEKAAAVVEEAVASVSPELMAKAAEVVVAEVDAFSYYTVEFTYEAKTVSIKGDAEAALAPILAELGITGRIVSAAAYQDEACTLPAENNAVVNEEGEVLFRVYAKGGEWFVEAVKAFETTHGLFVVTEDGQFRLKVTDETNATGQKAEIRSYVTKSTENLRTSELLYVYTEGFKEGATLTYTYTLSGGESGSDGTRIYVSDSYDQNIDNGDYTQIYQGQSQSGRTTTKKYFALCDDKYYGHGTENANVTVTVTVSDGTNTVTCSHKGFGAANLQDDIQRTAVIVFVNDSQSMKAYYGLSGVVHINCKYSTAQITGIADRSIASYTNSSRDATVTGLKTGVTTMNINVSKSTSCAHHNGQNVSATNTVYVVNQPEVGTDGENAFIIVRDIPVGVVVTIAGETFESTEGNQTMVVQVDKTGTYAVEASVYDKDLKIYTSASVEVDVEEDLPDFPEGEFNVVHDPVEGKGGEPNLLLSRYIDSANNSALKLSVTPVAAEGYKATGVSYSYTIDIGRGCPELETVQGEAAGEDSSFVVDIDNNIVTSKPFTLTIHYTKVEYVWEYSVDPAAPATVVASCEALEPQYLTISAEDGHYDGESHPALLENSATYSGTLGDQEVSYNDIVYYVKNEEDGWTKLDGGVPVDAGTYKATITVGGATAETVYTIDPRVHTDEPAEPYEFTATVDPIEDQVYTGSAIEPHTFDPSLVKVYDGDKEISPDNYDVTYENNVEPGKATVIITFKNNYIGELTTSFNITEKLYTVSISVTNGSSDPTGSSTQVAHGKDCKIYFTAEEGYALDTVVVDEAPADLSKDDGGTYYTFAGVVADGHKIEVVYSTDENGDGTPDAYQTTVTYAVEHGTWAEGGNDKKTSTFDLYEKVNGEWVKLEGDKAPKLGSTIPEGMVHEEGYTQTTPAWNEPITAATSVTGPAEYTYSFGTELDKFDITVSVTNGTATPADTTKTVIYNDSYSVSFAANDGFALDTVTVDGNPATLTDNAYSFTNVKGNRSIEVVYETDEKGNPDDPENKGDGIPDKYQLPVTFTVENGVIAGTEDTEKTVYVTLFDDKGKWSEEGEGHLTANQVPTTSGNEGYTTEKGWSPADPTEATITKETANSFTFTYEPGEFAYVIEYYRGADEFTPAGAPTEGTGTFGQPTDEKVEDYEKYEVVGYALDTIEQCESIGTVKENNVVKVKYLEDKFAEGEENEKLDESDGIPDEYQATVTYTVYHGSWAEGGNDPKTYFFTLKERDGNGWKDVEPAKTLGDTIPVGMVADAEYSESDGKWDAEFNAETEITGTVEYEYSFGEEKNEYTITVMVENGKSIPSTTCKTVKHGEGYEVGFLPNSGFVLDTVTVNGDPAELTDNVYTFTNVTDDMAIFVTFSEDAKGDPDLPEKKGDGIPDKYQVKVTFTVENGKFADGSTTKTAYVTKLDEDNKWSETGEADVSDVVPGVTPNEGYEEGSWSPDTATAIKEATDYTNQCKKGEFDYVIKYYRGADEFDPEGAPTEGTGTFGESTALKYDDYTKYAPKKFALDTIEQCESIGTDKESNVVKVNFAKDEESKEGKQPDGIPDKYQTTVTYSIHNGTWDGEHSDDKTEFFTLKKLEDGQWKDDPQTLKGTVPTAMQPDEGYQSAQGEWSPATPTEDTEVTEKGATYLFSYGDEKDKIKITVAVENGTADPSATEAQVEYGQGYEVSFTADEGFALDTVTVNGDPAELTDNAYSFTNVKTPQSIVVTYAEDAKGDPDDPENKGDGIPDKYQVKVTFTVENGGFADGSTTKTAYVTKLDEDNKWSETGEADVSGVVPGVTPNEGYEEGSWSPDTATAIKEATDYTHSCEKGEFDYVIKYYRGADEFDPEGAPTEGKGTFGESTALKYDDYKKYAPEKFALDTIEQCESIGTDKENNVVKVNFAKDETGPEGESDRIPDKYQATVTYSIHNGTWDGEDSKDKTEFFTLKELEDGQWKDDPQTLDDTIPEGMKADEAYTQHDGKWDAEIGPETQVTGDARYEYSFGDEKNEYIIAVTVLNGKSVPSTTIKTVKHGEGYEVCFLPQDSSFVLDTVTVNDTPDALDSYNTYTFTNVKENKTIFVTFSTDVKGDPTDPENKGDGIPDKYQVKVTFTVENGEFADGSTTKTAYVTKLDEDNKWSETGKAKLTNAEIPATEGKEGYVKAEPFWNTEPTEAEIIEAVTFTGTYELGKFGYTIEYTFDEKPGTAPEGAPTEGKQTFGESTDEKVTDYEKFKVEGYALDTIEQCESIGTDEAANVVKVNYAKDETGPEGESDGIPDKYQATVTYKIYNGSWDGEGDKDDKTEFFTLKLRDGNGWKDNPQTLKGTVPAGMQPDEEYQSAEGKWSPVTPTDDTEVTEEGATYLFSYGDEKDKIKITVVVENGTADPSATEVEVEYGGSYTVRFRPNTGYKLDSVKVDDETAELNEGAYTFENVTAPRKIEVKYAADEFAYTIQYYYDGVKGDSESGGNATFGQSTTVASTDPKVVGSINYMMGSVEQCVITAEPANNVVRVYYLSDMLGNDSDDPTNPNKPDNIPDLYQVVVTFKTVNGTVDGTNAKTAVVLNKFDGQGKQSADGTAHLVNVPTPVPNTGYQKAEPFWSPAEPTTTLDIKEDETFTATYVLGKYGYSIQYYYNGEKGDSVSGGEADFGTETAVKAEATVTVSGETEKHYALEKVVQCTIGTTAESNVVEVYYLSDEKGGVNQNNPDEPDLPDGIPDIYEAVVKFSVTEGTGTVTENRYAVVSLRGEDGELSATGKGHLTAEQLPKTAPATGYVVPETDFWSPAEPDTSADITKDCEFIATYVLGEYAYTIQNYYDGVEGDKIEGNKAEFGSTPSVTPEPKRSYSDKTYAYDSITLCTIGTVAENNVVKVYYGLDEYGPESFEEGDGIPDSHQAKVVFHIEGGTWDGSDTNDKTCVYTLEKLAEGQWTAVAPAPVLDGDVPTGMKPASGNEDKVGGWHLETKPVTIDANTPVTGNATYVYNYEQKFEAEKTAAEDLPDLGEDLLFTITVENKTEAETLTDIVVSEAPGNLIVKVDGVELENPVRVYTIETLAAGATTVLTVAHTVTEADIAKGSYKNEATVSCRGAVIELTDEGDTAKVNNEITTTKTIDKLNTRPTGEDGKYALGDTVRYLITVTNTGNRTLSNVTVTEQEGVTILADDPATYAVTCDPSTGIYTATLIGTLAPGGKLTVYAELTVSGEDVLKGKVVNEAAVSALAADGKTSVEPQVQPKDENAETEEVKAKLDFEKTAKVYDKDSHELKEKAAVGDTVEFTFHVVNSGNVPVKGATVSDTMLGYTGTPTDLAVGEEFTETKEYTVTEADVLSGSIENSATVTGEAEPEGSDPVEARTDASTKVPTEDVKAEFEFGKAFVAEEPAKEYYLPGETVNYALTVKNKGNVSLQNVVVTEQKGMTVLPGDGYKVEDGKAVIDTLAPDATVTVSVSHKLTEKEVLKGTLKNVANVKADKLTDPKTGEDIEPKAEASNSDAPLGKTTYTVVYQYDGTEGTAPSATAPVKGEGCVGDVTEVTGVPATASYYGVSYALDEVVQIKLDKDASKNVVIVSYAADKLGNDPDDPEKPAKPDGVPDKYQATVTFQVENGYWDNGRDKDQKVVYTLYEQVEGEWKLKSPAPTLEKLPAVGEGKSGYPLAGGWKDGVDETKPVVDGMVCTYHFGAATVETIGDKTYTGEPIVPDPSEIVVRDEQGRVIDPSKYEVTVSDNTDVGEAVVTITFKDELSGEVEGEFNIVPKEHNDDHDNTKPKQDDPAKPDYNPGDFRAITDPIDPQQFTGEPIEPTVTVRDETGKKLIPGVDYEIVGYEDNVEPGTGTVEIEFKGNYEGELEVPFEIKPNGYLIVPPVDPQGNLFEKYEVDGKTDTVEDVDGEALIVRESPDAFVVTGINYSDDEDPHDKYPTDMTTDIVVYNPETGRFDVVKSYFDLIRYEGCSIRIGSDKRGLRVVSSISRKFKDELVNTGVELNGKVYRMTEYGTLMAWTKELGDRTLSYELVATGIAKYGVAFSKRSDLLYQQTAERDYWCNVVTSKDGKLTDAQICTDMTLRPYAVMTADDGTTFYIYGGEVVRSIGSVAVQNQDVYAPGTWEDEAIEELVDIYKKKGSEF